MNENLYFTNEKLSLSYKHIINPNQKKTILCFYGFCGNIEMLESLSSYIVNEYSLLVIDYPGHGNSSVNTIYEINDIADLANDLLIYLKIKEVYLLGYSFGGIVSLRFYKKFNEKIKKIIFLNSTYKFCRGPLSFLFFKLFEYMLKINFFFVMDYIAIPYLKDKFFTKELLSQAKIVIRKNDIDGVLYNYKKIIYNDEIDLLSLIGCPVFIFGSNSDRLISRNSSKKFASEIKGAKFKIFNDIGHLSIVTKPDTISTCILEFFRE
jgi:pimeloyl-ACP methyl ester carboxylesterase